MILGLVCILLIVLALALPFWTMLSGSATDASSKRTGHLGLLYYHDENGVYMPPSKTDKTFPSVKYDIARLSAIVSLILLIIFYAYKETQPNLLLIATLLALTTCLIWTFTFASYIGPYRSLTFMSASPGFAFILYILVSCTLVVLTTIAKNK